MEQGRHRRTDHRAVRAAFALIALIGTAATAWEPPKQDTAPVEWPASDAGAFALARAIVKSALIDARQCDVAIRARTMQRLENKDACVRAIYVGLKGTRQQQGAEKLLTLLKQGQRDQLLAHETDQALRELTELHSLVVFIKERFAR